MTTSIQKPTRGTRLRRTHPICEDLVAMWIMNEGTGKSVKDVTGNRHTGTIASGVSWSGGDFGSVLDFANSKVTTASRPLTRMTGGGTIVARIKVDSISGYPRIVDKGTDDAATDGYKFFLQDSGRLAFLVDDEGGQVQSDDSVIPTGQWCIVAVTFDGSGRSLYLNGVDITSAGGSRTTLPPNVAGTVAIGNKDSDVDRAFDGQIDYVAMWRRVLDEGDLADLQVSPYSMFEGYGFVGFTGSTQVAIIAAAGSLTNNIALTGQTNGNTVTASMGTMKLAQGLSGDAASDVTVEASEFVWVLDGQAVNDIAASGDLSVTMAMQDGIAANDVQADGNMDSILEFTGVATTDITPSGTLSVSMPISGDGVNDVSVSGPLSVVMAASGDTANDVAASASGITGVPLSGSVANSISISANLDAGQQFTGQAVNDVSVAYDPNSKFVNIRPVVQAWTNISEVA